MKRLLMLVLLVVLMVGCNGEPTPTEPTPTTSSPIPTTSPLATPAPAVDAGALVAVEKSLDQMEGTNQMDAKFLARIAGIALSLTFSYIPLAQKRYDTLGGIAKRLVMAGLLVLVAAATYSLSCWGVISGYVECTQAGLISTVGFFIDALIANQATFLISPKLKK